VDVALGDGEAELAVVWRAAFVVGYAAANAAAIALAGTAACGLRLQWYVALIALAFAMATLQTLVLFLAGVRVSAVRWWPLTLGATVSVTPLAFGVVYVFGVILLGGLATLGVEQGTEAVAAVVFMLPAAFAGVFIAGLQFFAFRSPPDNLLVAWFGANALAGFVGAPAIENVALGCANIGIGPSWIESPIGWVAAGAIGGVLTGLVLARLRISR
jgi:hypothetical protein